MIPQLDTQITSSFLIFVQREILRQGWAYQNQSSLFYPADEDEVNGLYTYTSPYRPFVNDTSISGANVMSGVFINGNFTTVGSSGLVYINHPQGAITLNYNETGTISGNFAQAEYNCYISDQADYKSIFTTKYSSNPKYNNAATGGLPLEERTFPCVAIVVKNQENRDFAFGGLADNYMKIRCVVISETAFQRIAIGNILKNLKLKPLPLVIPNYDYLGNMTGIQPFNFLTAPIISGQNPIIMTAKVVEIPESESFIDVEKQFSMVDCTISTFTAYL